MTNNTKKVFYQDSGYPIKRNLLNVPLSNYEPKKKIGFNKVLTHLHYKLCGTSSFLSNFHWEFLKKNNGIWHFFNGISFGQTPWVVTFETKVPRWPESSKSLQEYGVKALASERCKSLIAMSECTKDIQVRFLEEEFPSYTPRIKPKITVIHPPQELLIDSLADKQTSRNKLTFTLIGADFFRKGGREVLFVFDRLLRNNMPVKLNIISTLQIDDYASKATSDDLRKAITVIEKYPDAIQHYDKLANKEVLELLKNSDIGLLPTWGDTYGYSVLEAQACGCPVISTNLRALSEINGENYGWLIEVPKNRWGDGKLDTPGERNRFSDLLTAKLYDIVCGIISDPYQVQKKSKACIDRIKEEHNPKEVADQLEKIYSVGLSTT